MCVSVPRVRNKHIIIIIIFPDVFIVSCVIHWPLYAINIAVELCTNEIRNFKCSSENSDVK